MVFMIPVLAPPAQSDSPLGGGCRPDRYSVILEAIEEKGFYLLIDHGSFSDIQDFPYRSQGYNWLPKRVVDESGRSIDYPQLAGHIPRSPHK